MQVLRAYEKVPSHLSAVPDNFRRYAQELKIIIPDSIQDVDILNVHDEVTRFASFSEEDELVLAALSRGIAAFGYDGSEIVPVNQNNEPVDWNFERIK